MKMMGATRGARFTVDGSGSSPPEFHDRIKLNLLVFAAAGCLCVVGRLLSRVRHGE